MKVLTAAQMREIDRRTIEMGMPGVVLMENAGHRVTEFLERRFAPLSRHRVVILCGKGNNGGDGLVVARQLHTRLRPRSLDVVLAAEPSELKGDATTNHRMLEMTGCPIAREITPEMRRATLVLDALLGTGIQGAASGVMLDLIREINTGFPGAAVVAVDIPSGMASDESLSAGETVRAGATVTFTAPKAGQVLPPNCDAVGELIVGAIGSPPALYEEDASIWLSLIEPAWFRPLFGPRPRAAHKGDFGHVLVVGGSFGKTGAAAMAGVAALRAGAGLVTVASEPEAIPSIAAHAPELMTEVFGSRPFDRKTLLAVGPGLGTEPEMAARARTMTAECKLPMVLDADALTVLAGGPIATPGPRILTPHPGEMARLAGLSTAEVQRDRVGAARGYALQHGVTLVLKGQRTLIAFRDGRVWINPTGTPAMATAGSGDILTGLIAGLAAQFPGMLDEAVAAAVWLHGRTGEITAARLGEKCLMATDLLAGLPQAIDEISHAE